MTRASRPSACPTHALPRAGCRRPCRDGRRARRGTSTTPDTARSARPRSRPRAWSSPPPPRACSVRKSSTTEQRLCLRPPKWFVISRNLHWFKPRRHEGIEGLEEDTLKNRIFVVFDFFVAFVVKASEHRSTSGMTIDLLRQRTLADAAERHGIAREHDAVDLGTIERPGVVVRALEQTDLPTVLRRGEELHLDIDLAPEELRHLRLRPLVRTQLGASGLILLLHRLELLLRPRCRQ